MVSTKTDRREAYADWRLAAKVPGGVGQRDPSQLRRLPGVVDVDRWEKPVVRLSRKRNWVVWGSRAPRPVHWKHHEWPQVQSQRFALEAQIGRRRYRPRQFQRRVAS